MVFSSLIFLFAFLPLAILCYYAAPACRRNLVLFLFSLFFYGWGEPVYLLLMLASITGAYLFGFAIEKYRTADPRRSKVAMILSVTFNLLFLFFFKYYHFFAKNLSLFPFINLPIIEKLALPIGISFYTFQIISYTVDLYRGDCRLQKNFISFGTYVVLFPQLIAGPIVRYREIDAQLAQRKEGIGAFSHGIVRFVCGLGKKILLGDMLFGWHTYFRDLFSLQPTVVGAWMTVILYTLHLYYDFSGYSDMAIGLGKLFGFDFPENFRYPYISKSITEFWRRWHISLSTWFREYIYIPLGGNRKGRWRTYRNLAVVWLLTGLWHGASWNFVLWGVYFGVILILEKAFMLKLLEKLPQILRHFYTLFLVVLGFLIFSYTDFAEGWQAFQALFGVGCDVLITAPMLYHILHLLPLLALAMLGATPLPHTIFQKVVSDRPRLQPLVPLLTLFGLILCTAYLVDSTFSPFAYTQF